jgi:hypothetical protein
MSWKEKYLNTGSTENTIVKAKKLMKNDNDMPRAFISWPASGHGSHTYAGPGPIS